MKNEEMPDKFKNGKVVHIATSRFGEDEETYYYRWANTTPSMPILERGSTYRYTSMDYMRYMWKAIKFAVRMAWYVK